MKIFIQAIITLAVFFVSSATFASASPGVSVESLSFTNHWVGYVSLGIFMIAYALVIAEEYIHLRKSKPVIIAAGVIWGMIGYIYTSQGLGHVAGEAARHNLLEYAELMLFLLVAMTYINAMEERNVFAALRSWLVQRGFSLKQIFWLTGLLAFFISPVADNLTTALLMSAVIMAVGEGNKRFIGLASINIVVAANAGGAFSPFGDITTLMVWQKGVLDFGTFFALFIPSFVNFLVPAIIMQFALPKEKPVATQKTEQTKRGAKRIIALFLLTIITAVGFHNYLGLPPVLGMLTGLGYLQVFGFYLRITFRFVKPRARGAKDEKEELRHDKVMGSVVPFDVFNRVARAEWDTLLFFYGVVMSVGGLGFLGYLALVSDFMYSGWGATQANIAIGLISSIVDNIPVMFAVLTMQPEMSQGQWLLVTLTAGVGGSLLSIGSAAGVAIMGQSKGNYTFFGHLKWMPAIAAGYIASIATHMWLNAELFLQP
ncbi:MAG: sodium:proton antiporter NhaD [Gammaproteobacteria bacterium]|nr:MAG: sodium:proton antiporter NhaD [Gammaproteobacteria bacterium]